MIPLKMHIKNFLSYGPETQTIDFSSYPLICLSGKNGHGKSALLDAITWAVWGQARKVSNNAKADQGLLHLGQSTMMVTFDFMCNGNTYRVKREYAHLYGKPYTNLEFGVIDGEAIRPLTDKTIRGTQHVIEQTLHISFDSFVNSAFLRQGHSNEFSKKTPKERKEILGAILGLDTYESIRKRALEKSKELLTQKQTLTLLLEKASTELAQKTSLETEHAHIRKRLEEIKHTMTQQEQVLTQLNRVKKECAELDTHYEVHTQSIANLEKNYRDGCVKIRSLLAQWRKVHAQQLSAHQLPELEQRARDLSHDIMGKQKMVQELMLVKQQAMHAKEELNASIYRAQTAHQNALLSQTLELEKEKNKFQIALNTQKDLEKSIASLSREMASFTAHMEKNRTTARLLSTQTRDYEVLEKQFEKRKEFYHAYVNKRNMLKAQLEELDQKQHLVATDEDPSCPLCEQNLSASRKRFLKNKFFAEHRFITHRHNRLLAITKKLKEILIEQHGALEIVKKHKNDLVMLDNEYVQHQTKMTHLQNDLVIKQDELSLITLALEQMSTHLEREQRSLSHKQNDHSAITSDAHYIRLKAAVDELEKQCAPLETIQSQLQKNVHELHTIQTTISEFKELSASINKQPERKDELRSLISSLKNIKQQQTELIKIKENIATARASLYQQLAQESVVSAQMTELTAAKELLLQQLGTINAHKQKLDALEQETATQRAALEALVKRCEDFAIIAHATGKDGVQALLIEEAIPEIEQEANYLLAKLTNNQAHLFIESLKDLKKGGAKETLDIKISDALGIRPYELFSGGEAFRIDFALRIAISKLLARRSGTSLQTLIIDEGFGSQDEEGLGHIMDALYKIQEDFAKIIIVSHLPSMKEQFPVHFTIEKGPKGSLVRIIEHD